MPLNLTKIAFGAQSYNDIESWYAGRRSPHLTTKYRPTKWEECIGGSLYAAGRGSHPRLESIFFGKPSTIADSSSSTL